MKSIEEIKNEIHFAVDNKKFDGFIENDCLYVESPAGGSIIMTAFAIFLPILVIIVGLISSITGIDIGYLAWIVLLYLLVMILWLKFGKDYIVYDYNYGKIFYSTKLFSKTICKSFCTDVRNIAEIGTNNVYEPRRNNNDLFKRPKDDEIFEYHFKSNVVYLNTEGKLKNLSAYIFDKQLNEKKLMLENLSKFCSFFASLLEIPCKICDSKQKLELINIEGSLKKTLNIVPIDLEKEKKNRLIFVVKIYFLRLFIGFLFALIPIVTIFIKEYGFKGGLLALAKFLLIFFTEFVPRQLGLK